MKKPIQFFEELTAIPRASGEEQGICDYLERFAQQRGLSFRRDRLHNAVIKKSGTPGGDTVMLQAHTDIVPVKDEDILHDFSRDPVRLIKEGDIWSADGTTLGADNGLGVAMMLAILDDAQAVHPDIECVFTAQEETGLFGAAALDVSDLAATRMINLDCGGEGYFTTSCAGGVRVRIQLPVAREAAQGRAFSLEIGGLCGGHSGGNIHLGRANAVQLLARAALALDGARLCSIEGGDRDNVIPSYAKAVLLCDEDPADAVAAIQADFKAQFAATEPDLSLTLTPCPPADRALTQQDSLTALRLIVAAPCGVRALVPGQGGLVESSANIGSVALKEDALALNISLRSSNDRAKAAMVGEIKALCDLSGASMTTGSDYPGWAYVQQSPLRDAVAKAYRAFSGEEGTFFGIHAGLECGLFIGKMPGLDAIAMGANSGGAHTTKEWMSVSSLERTYAFLKALLADLAK